MSLLGLGSIIDLAKTIVDKFPKKLGDKEKAAITLQVQNMISQRETVLMESQKSIIVAELNQGDTFTKRARPSIVYFGLTAIGIVHVILPIAAWLFLMVTGEAMQNMPDISLPSQFWVTWGGVCGVWIVGRSAEKRGVKNKIVNMITGG